MKKSSFVAMVLGTVAGVFFALGMCMCLLPEWDTFNEGVIFGAVGILLGLVTLAVWRKMEHKKPVKLNGRAVALCALGVLGALALGTGMCFSMLWDKMVLGILIGLLGILMLLSLIPLIKGIK